MNPLNLNPIKLSVDTIPINNITEWPKRPKSLSLVFLPTSLPMLTTVCNITSVSHLIPSNMCHAIWHMTRMMLAGSCAGKAAAPMIEADHIHIIVATLHTLCQGVCSPEFSLLVWNQPVIQITEVYLHAKNNNNHCSRVSSCVRHFCWTTAYCPAYLSCSKHTYSLTAPL